MLIGLSRIWRASLVLYCQTAILSRFFLFVGWKEKGREGAGKLRQYAAAGDDDAVVMPL